MKRAASRAVPALPQSGWPLSLASSVGGGTASGAKLIGELHKDIRELPLKDIEAELTHAKPA